MSGAASPDRAGEAAGPNGVSRARRWFGPLLSIPTPAIFVGAAVVAALFLWRQGALDEIGDSLRAVPPWKAIAILLLYALSILVLGLRWHALVTLAGGSVAWTSSSEVFFTSVIINYAAPIGLAVPTRAALTVRDLGLSPGQSGAVVAWEAGLDVLALSAVSVAWLGLGGLTLIQSLTVDPRLVGGIAVFVFVAVGALGFVARRTETGRRLASVLGQTLRLPARNPATAMLAVALTALFWATQIGVMAAILSVFGAEPTVALLFGLMGLPILIGMLSPVPGGAGVREALMAAAARLEGVPTGPVVLAAIAYRLALFVVTPVVWGLVRLARPRAQ